MEPMTNSRTSALSRTPSNNGGGAQARHGRPVDGHARAWLPIVAAAATFAAAFGIGAVTKSSSSPQTATSLAPAVTIQAPSASVPALQPGVPTPGLTQRPAPPKPKPKPAPATSAVTPAPSVPAAPPPSPGVIHNQPPPGIVHHGSAGSGVVHGGN